MRYIRKNFAHFAVICAACIASAAVADTGASGAEPGQDSTDFKSLRNPIPFTKRSIARGKTLYDRRCVECHGPDGRAMMDVIADATDLTSPKLWRNGTAVGEVFHSIRDGAGVSMPPFKDQIRREDDIWHLVNFIQSLWPKSMQPQLQEETDNEEDGGKSSDGGGTNDE